MSEVEKKEALNAMSVCNLRMISVILDLKLFRIKLELIESIIQYFRHTQRVMQVLLSLQRTANHSNKMTVNTSILEESRLEETLECPICFSAHRIDGTFMTNCKHSFCLECMKQHLKRDVQCKCPMCRTKIVELALKTRSSDEEILGRREYLL